MIQAYINSNTDYAHNGDMVLMPTQCDLTAKLNGTWAVKLVHPIDAEGRWRYITDEAVIKMPSFNGTQLFRVYERKKSDKGVEAKLLPIFYDAAKEVFIVDKRPTYMTGQQALNVLTEGTAYTGQSDIATLETAYYIRKNLLECISGKDDNAFIKRWGGEAIYDNKKIILNTRAGSDNGVTVRYGMNLQTNGFEETVDLSNVVTRIYPEGYRGVTSTTYVDSPLIDSYPNVRCAVREYRNIRMSSDVTSDDTEGLTICYTQEELDTALTAAAEADFAAGLDKPTVTIKAKMVLLQNVKEYEGYQNLQSVSLGDTVHAFHTRLGITTSLRVCELVYDAITEKVSEVTLGEPQYNYFDSQVKTLNKMSQDIVDVSGATQYATQEARQALRTADYTKAYFWYDDEGAHVATVDGDASQGKNVLIDADGMAIRDGETDLATFGSSLIELGKSNPQAEISLIDDSLRMKLTKRTAADKQLFALQEIYSDEGLETHLNINVSNGDPDHSHMNPTVVLFQGTSPDYRTEIQLLAEKILLAANSFNQTSEMVLSAEASMNLNCNAGIYANGNPISPYKENTSITGVRLIRQGNIVVMMLNKSVAMTANTQFSIGTIPQGYRPKAATVIVAQYATTSTPNGSARLVANTDGSFVGQESSHTGTYALYATACWVTDNTIS